MQRNPLPEHLSNFLGIHSIGPFPGSYLIWLSLVLLFDWLFVVTGVTSAFCISCVISTGNGEWFHRRKVNAPKSCLVNETNLNFMINSFLRLKLPWSNNNLFKNNGEPFGNNGVFAGWAHRTLQVEYWSKMIHFTGNIIVFDSKFDFSLFSFKAFNFSTDLMGFCYHFRKLTSIWTTSIEESLQISGAGSHANKKGCFRQRHPTKLCAWITLNCPLLQDSLEFESHDLLWIPSGKPSDLELANYEIFRTLLDILGYVVSVSFAEIFDQKFVLRPNSLHTLITFEKSTSLNKFWSKSLFSLSYDDLTIVFIVSKTFR